jgi:hypothetical protein
LPCTPSAFQPRVWMLHCPDAWWLLGQTDKEAKLHLTPSNAFEWKAIHGPRGVCALLGAC